MIKITDGINENSTQILDNLADVSKRYAQCIPLKSRKLEEKHVKYSYQTGQHSENTASLHS
jgi:hypothetical protein